MFNKPPSLPKFDPRSEDRGVRRLWKSFRRWPIWAQVIVALFTVGVLAAPFTQNGSTQPTAATSNDSSLADPVTVVPNPPAPAFTPPPVAPVVEPSAPPAPAPSTPPPAPRPVVRRSTVSDPPVQHCHPSYTGACLDPNASDYDCIGGSGDGPLYTGPVRVVGPDEYRLDADHDGYGCENS
jgi:hypothetical protein